MNPGSPEFVGPPPPTWSDHATKIVQLINGLDMMQLWLFTGGALIFGILIYGQFRHDGFDLRDMICDKDGRWKIVNQEKVFTVGCWLATTWLLLYMGIKGTLTEWYFTFYMLIFVGSRLGQRFLDVYAKKTGIDVNVQGGQTVVVAPTTPAPQQPPTVPHGST